VIALAARDPERAREAAATFGIPRAYGSYAQLLADGEVEAVYNPLPNDLHARWTIRALEAGKHVLCEKPIALNAAEARQIEAAARSSGRLVAEAFMVRFHPQWQRVKALIDGGHLGEVRAVQAFFAYDNPPGPNLRNDPAHGGGGLYDVGGYCIVAGRMIFGTDPESAIGLFDRDEAGGVDRLVSALVAFPHARQLSLICSTRLLRTQRVVIHGNRGRLEVAVPFNPTPGRPTRLLLDDGRDLYGGGVTIEEIPGVDQYALQCDEFSRAVREGRTDAGSMRDALVNMLTIDALFRSERSRRWESVQ
jgi:predicted dehydrogenase